MVEIKNYCKSIKSRPILNNVSYNFEYGKIYGIYGHNGSGKTMLLRAIAGLLVPDSGSVVIDGKVLHKDMSFPPSIGIVIENMNLLPQYNAFDNLKILGKIKKTATDEDIKTALERVGLKSDLKVKKFSLGMKQRLGIALALVGNPDFLVLDEPINGLDPQGIVEIRDMLQRLSEERNITILISSHILEELSKLCTDFGIIHNGVLLQEISQEQLIQQCSKRLELTLDQPEQAMPILDRLGITRYEMIDVNHLYLYERLEDSAQINAQLVEAGVFPRELRIYQEELERYFLNMTAEK